MRYEMLVGLEVINDVKYQQYREAMMPILKKYHGDFGYDFKVSEVLRSPTQEGINRVFTIHFSNEGNMKCFFEDPNYLKVKDLYFTAAVASTTIISSYQNP